MTFLEPRPVSPRPVVAVTLFALALLPGWLTSGFAVSGLCFNLFDPVQRATITPTGIVLLTLISMAGLAPFAAAARVLRRGHRRGDAWTTTLLAGAEWAAGTGVIAFIAVMFMGGGL
ncbi:hypothetical protein AB3X52_00875 [Nocardioides sp. DS6]|uniref:DUF4190 domain-containing protein n=1 Tax=Nocardioides eburneus TaxID=3231482 RepID=A0ABV3SUL5_9ACTN